MSVVVMGTSFKTATIESREQVSIPAAELDACLEQLGTTEGIDGVVILSTCNRTEVYVDAKTERIGADTLTAFFRDRAGDAYDAACFYLHRELDAVNHVLRVVCSLDSQLLGEAQILGQTKRAFEASTAAGYCDEVLTKLFKSALHLGKEVRSETAIGSDSVSLSTTAVRVAKEVFPDLAHRRIVIVGTGEMARLAATYLAEENVKDLVVTTRTPANGMAFAADFGATYVPFEQRYKAIATASVVFAMTSAPEPVLACSELSFARALAYGDDAGQHRLVIVDEAVPRDVEPGCGDLPGVILHNLETLGAIIDAGLAQRLTAVADVERRIATVSHEFFVWMQQRMVAPTIKEIYEKSDAIVESELNRAIKSLSNLHGKPLSDEESEILAAFGNAIAKKLLHGPTMRLRREASSASSYSYTGAARYLFGLDTFPAGSANHRHCCPDRFCEKMQPCPNGHPPLTPEELATLAKLPEFAFLGSITPKEEQR